MISLSVNKERQKIFIYSFPLGVVSERNSTSQLNKGQGSMCVDSLIFSSTFHSFCFSSNEPNSGRGQFSCGENQISYGNVLNVWILS